MILCKLTILLENHNSKWPRKKAANRETKFGNQQYNQVGTITIGKSEIKCWNF